MCAVIVRVLVTAQSSSLDQPQFKHYYELLCVITTHQRDESKVKEAKCKFPRRQSNPGGGAESAESYIYQPCIVSQFLDFIH